MTASGPRPVLQAPTVRAAAVASGASVGILIFKFAAYLITGSVAILSDAAESVVNVVAANVALVSLMVAARPPDAGHQYGHGKAEYISGATEGVLITAAGLWIVVTAVRRLLQPVPLQWLGVGAVTLAVATVANSLVARLLLRISREAGSVALEAEARHLQADVLTSLAVFAGLGLVWLTGRQWLDPVVGGVVGLHVLRMGAQVTRQAVGGLMDSSLPADEEAAVRQVLDAHREEIVDYHALRARRVGSDRFIDLHLVLHRDLPVGQAHALCDRLEDRIRELLPGTDITIHVEPCGPSCTRCAA